MNEKTKSIVIVSIVILVLSAFLSFLLFNNADKKTEKKKNTAATVVMAPENEEKPKEEEPVVELPKEDPTPVKPEPPVEEPPKQEEKPVNKRATLNSKYKILKEDTQKVTLNKNNHEIYTSYYADPAEPKKVRKIVYFDTKLIYYNLLSEVENEGDIIPLINDDIKKVNKYSYIFDDVSNKNEYYLIRLFDDYYTYNEEGDEEDEPSETVIILDETGKFLFYDAVTYSGYGSYWLKVDNKDEVLDRSYYVDECYSPRKMDDGNYACNKKYILYDGTYDTELITPYAYEFLKDHFYGFSYEAIENEDDYDHKVYDRVYYIQQGVLKTKLLNTYVGDEHFAGAGGD